MKLDLYASPAVGRPYLHVHLNRGTVVQAHLSQISQITLPYHLVLEQVYLGFIPHTCVGLICTLFVLITSIVALRLPQRFWSILAGSESKRTD